MASLAPNSPAAVPNDNVLPNPMLSESPVSTNQSTPAVLPIAEYVEDLASDDTVPPLRLDDIQSAMPFDEAFGNNESGYMRTFYDYIE